MDGDTLLHMLCRDCEGAPRWKNPEWLHLLHTGSDKKSFQHCLNPDVFIHYMRAIQGHSGGNKVDQLLLDNLYKLRTSGTSTFITLVLLICMHSTLHSGLTAGGKDTKEERQTFFFTAVDPMSDWQEEEYKTCQSHEWYSTRPSGKCSTTQNIGPI